MRMRIPESCAACLYRKQTLVTEDVSYLAEVRRLIDQRNPDDTSPYMVYLFSQVHEKMFGKVASYRDIKRKYNDLVLSMEKSLRKIIIESEDPIKTSLAYARVGNYIDFGALDDVDEETFLSLFTNAKLQGKDLMVAESMLSQCANAKTFLLITDNCGEIVLDKLFLEELHKRFPTLALKVMVRGDEALNDATTEDAMYVGIDQVAEVVHNGQPVAGTIYEMLPEEAKEVIDNADVILAKGQGNYESLNGRGRHIFYSFLCKCDYFMSKFDVPRLTGMFIEEME